MTPSTGPSSASSLELLTEKAKEDLAQRLNISISPINTVEAKAVTWPDSSLGCPEPGMLYTQVLADGYLIRLEVSGKTYEYHANRDTRVFLCEHPSLPAPDVPGDR